MSEFVTTSKSRTVTAHGIFNTITNPDNGGSGYIKADQLYYFNKNKIDYRVIGYINEDILDLLFEFIEESEFEIVNITDNL